LYELASIHKAAHGNLGPGSDYALEIGKISLLLSYPQTQVLKMGKNHPDYWKLSDSSTTHSFSYVFELALQLCSMSEAQDVVEVRTNGASARSVAHHKNVLIKLSSSNQSGHGDGGLRESVRSPSFGGMLFAISDFATLRIWELSHDLMEDVHDAVHNISRFKRSDPAETSSSAQPLTGQEDQRYWMDVWDYVATTAAPGSLVRSGQKIFPKPIFILPGQSAMFLLTKI
jgi:hypothetical protein